MPSSGEAACVFLWDPGADDRTELICPGCFPGGSRKNAVFHLHVFSENLVPWSSCRWAFPCLRVLALGPPLGP